MNTDTNPVQDITLIGAVIGTLLASIVKLAVILDLVEWTAEQVASITLVVDNSIVAVTTVLIIVLVKRKVTPTANPNLPIDTIVNRNDPNVATAVVTVPGETAPPVRNV